MAVSKWLMPVVLILIVTRAGFGCSCMAILPAKGFDRAEAVFTGKVLRSGKTQWIVAVERIWKGEVESKVTVFDAHAGSSCSTAGYKRGKSYLFLVNVEKGHGDVRYSPQVCNWGTRLKSNRVSFGNQGPAKWVEDWVLMDRGEGRSPTKSPQ